MLKVSLLVPIYGVEKYIERCVRSLFEQTYPNIEYVFVNDCTKDKSVEILLTVLKEYPNRKSQVKTIHHHQNRGLSAARNTAVENMTGDYLWHIDSDDYIAIDAVEQLVNESQITKAEVVIFSHYKVYLNQIEYSRVQNDEKHAYIKQLLFNSIAASMWNKFYKSSFYIKTGIWSVEGINQGEDYAVVPRILYFAPTIAWLDKPLYFYNLSNESSYSKNISQASIESQKKADDVLYLFFKDIPDYTDVLAKLYVRSMLFLIKTSGKDRYQNIIVEYQDSFTNVVTGLSMSDRLILYLIRRRMFCLCYLIIICAKIISKCCS